MQSILLSLIIAATALLAPAQEQSIVRPFERESIRRAPNAVDVRVHAALRERGITPANLCSDEVFVRRVYMDVIGTLPKSWEVTGFLKNRNPGKRAALIDVLLEREEFADYWSLKWGDLLRVKAEFPINLWPNAVQAYHRWIHAAIRDNMPYDRFARELLTSSGSNFRVPPVNFYRAIQDRTPAGIAKIAALTFMGVRTDSWSAEARADMAVFFSRIAYKKTAEWKEEIVFLDPAPANSLEARYPDGTAVTIPPGADPRRIFADWLIRPENEWFTRNIVNRIWFWLLGRGIIHPVDDIRPDIPASNPELLALLESELIRSGYDLRHIYRLILNSGTYQQSSIPRSDHPDAGALFASYPVRRLDAEVLIDALCWICGPGEKYSSPIPEPFTFIPDNQRSILLSDGSITSPFLEMFGRPPRDTGMESERSNESTDAQRLHMLNSSHIQQKIERSWRLRNLLKTAKRDRQLIIDTIYLHVLSRHPTEAELAIAMKYFRRQGKNPKQAAADLVWALINSKEFLYRH